MIKPLNMNKIKALLFDLDGTLIDSEFFHFECWNEILKDYGVSLTYEDWLKNYAGIPLPKNAQNLLIKYSIDAVLDDIITRREALTLERLKTNDVNLMPFVLEFIEFFHSKGLILAIVTSSPRKDVDAIFQRNGFGEYFDLIITRTEVSKSKPDPESYNLCVEKLNLIKTDCLVFEDTINGVKSAVAAGITCFAIQSDIGAHKNLKLADQLFLNLAQAKDYIIENSLTN